MPEIKRREFLQSAAVMGSSLLSAPAVETASTQVAASTPPATSSHDILPMRAYLAQHDLIYAAPPSEWEEGIPLGNGDMGALIWGDGNPLRITLDKYDVWETRSSWPQDPQYNYKGLRELVAARRFDDAERIFMGEGRDPRNPAPTRLPMPRLEIDFAARPRSYAARLHLHGAMATGGFYLRGGRAHLERLRAFRPERACAAMQVAGRSATSAAQGQP